jgi:hypothetical protein
MEADEVASRLADEQMVKTALAVGPRRKGSNRRCIVDLGTLTAAGSAMVRRPVLAFS